MRPGKIISTEFCVSDRFQEHNFWAIVVHKKVDLKHFVANLQPSSCLTSSRLELASDLRAASSSAVIESISEGAVSPLTRASSAAKHENTTSHV